MNWKILQRHPLNVVPNADEQELEELRLSILEHGYDAKYPIWIFQGPDDAEPMVIDGMQRLGICYDLDETPLVREFNGTILEAIEFIERSIKRRNLTGGQRVIVFKELNTFKIMAREAEAALNSALNFPRALAGPMGKTSEWIASETGTSKNTVKQVNRIEKYSPELFEAVKQGKISTASAYRQVQEKQADSTQAAKMKAKNIIQKAINEAIRRDAPGYMAQVTKEVLENGTSNIKFKITLDD